MMMGRCITFRIDIAGSRSPQDMHTACIPGLRSTLVRSLPWTYDALRICSNSTTLVSLPCHTGRPYGLQPTHKNCPRPAIGTREAADACILSAKPLEPCFLYHHVYLAVLKAWDHSPGCRLAALIFAVGRGEPVGFCKASDGKLQGLSCSCRWLCRTSFPCFRVTASHCSSHVRMASLSILDSLQVHSGAQQSTASEACVQCGWAGDSGS